MSFTAQDRTDIIALAVAVWGAAPGASNLSDLAEHFKAGGTLEELIAELSQSPVFKTEYPTFLTNEEFVTKFVDNVVGGLVSADDRQWAIDTLTAEMNAGATQAQVILAAINALRDVPAGDENWGDAAQAFANRIEVAEYFSVTLQKDGSSMDDLKAVIADVDQTAASVTAGKAKADGTTSVPGQTFRLTTGQDEFVGGDGNDVFNALSINAVGVPATTLSAFDELDGGAGTDTLNIYSEDADGAERNETLPNSVTIKNIEIINIRNLDGSSPFTTDGASVVASRFEGAEQVWQFGWASDVTGLGAGVAAGFDNADLDGLHVTGTGSSVTVVMKNAFGAAGNNAIDFAIDGGAALNTANILGNIVKNPVNAVDAEELLLNFSVGPAQTVAYVNSEIALSFLELNVDSAADSVLHTLDASGSTGAITFDTADVDNAGAGADPNIRTVLTGSGNDTITTSAATNAALARHVLVDAGNGNNTVVVNTGGTGNTSVATGSGNDNITIEGTSEGTVTISTGAGNDVVTLEGRDNKATLVVDLGAGNDTFAFDGGVVKAGDSINGGSGTNTLQLKGVGASNVGAFTNFQLFDVVGMDDQILDVDILASKNDVQEIVGSGALADDSALINLGAGVGLRVTGDMGDNNRLSLTQKTAGALQVTMDADKATAGANATDAVIVAQNATSLTAVFDVDSAHTTAAANVQTLDLAGAAASSLSVISGGTNATNVLEYADPGNKLKSAAISGDQALTVHFAAVNSLTSITADNSAALTLTFSSSNALASVDASGMTGALTFDLGDLAATGTVKLGSGSDVITAQGAVDSTDVTDVIVAHRAIEGIGAAASGTQAAHSGVDLIVIAGVSVADDDVQADFRIDDGLLTFLGAGPQTLAQAVETAKGALGDNEAVVFQYIDNSYVLAQEAADDHALIKLSGTTDLGGLATLGADSNLFVFA